MDNDDPIHCGYFLTLPGNMFREDGITGDLLTVQDRFEPLGVKIVKINRMAILSEGHHNGIGYRMVETPRVRMRKDY